jgi:transposase
LTQRGLEAVERVGGAAYVPFKSNTVPPEDDFGVVPDVPRLFMLNRETFLEHYHKRSSAESAFSMIKAKFGDSLRSKSDTGQVNEALCKTLCHNISVLCHAMHRLAMEPDLCA